MNSLQFEEFKFCHGDLRDPNLYQVKLFSVAMNNVVIVKIYSYFSSLNFQFWLAKNILKNAFADLLVDTLYWFMHMLKIIYMFQTLAEVSFINQDAQKEMNLHKEKHIKHKMIIITCIK